MSDGTVGKLSMHLALLATVLGLTLEVVYTILQFGEVRLSWLFLKVDVVLCF